MPFGFVPYPQRMASGGIVSLVPSLTELVFALGAGERLAGRTRFCTEPAGAVEAVPIVGGTKNPRVDRITGLRPSLVLANKEENRREDIEALRAAGLNVLLTDPNTVGEACAMILEIGAALGCPGPAEALAAEVETALGGPPPGAPPRVAVAVWKEPFMALGAASYGHDLITRCGAVNVLAGRERYPEVTVEELRALRPDLLLLPDEPYPFTTADEDGFAAIAPARLIDGKLLWWYGPRMPAAIRQLRTLFGGTP